MACHEQDVQSVPAVELIAERGLEGLPDAVAVLISEGWVSGRTCLNMDVED